MVYKTETDKYILLTEGIFELLIQKGYTYFVKHEVQILDIDEEDETDYYELSFFKTEDKALELYNSIEDTDKFCGHIVDADASEMLKLGIIKFLIKDVPY